MVQTSLFWSSLTSNVFFWRKKLPSQLWILHFLKGTAAVVVEVEVSTFTVPAASIRNLNHQIM